MKARILILAIASTGISSAASISQTKDFSFIPTGTAALVFDKFDNQGGYLTLESITVTTNITKTLGSSLY